MFLPSFSSFDTCAFFLTSSLYIEERRSRPSAVGVQDEENEIFLPNISCLLISSRLTLLFVTGKLEKLVENVFGFICLT